MPQLQNYLFIADIEELKEFLLQKTMSTLGIFPETGFHAIGNKHFSTTQIQISNMNCNRQETKIPNIVKSFRPSLALLFGL
jgi:hypothetical protein